MQEILIHGLTLYAYHGVNPEETENGQPFQLDLVLTADLSRAMQSDRLEDTVNYSAVAKTVRAAFCARPYQLIEAAASRVADAVLAAFPQVRALELTLRKPHAPMNATFDYVAFRLRRERA